MIKDSKSDGRLSVYIHYIDVRASARPQLPLLTLGRAVIIFCSSSIYICRDGNVRIFVYISTLCKLSTAAILRFRINKTHSCYILHYLTFPFLSLSLSRKSPGGGRVYYKKKQKKKRIRAQPVALSSLRSV